jgi:hypothetical protein
MTSIMPQLVGLYRAAGYETISGFSPFHFFNVMDAPFTFFLKGQQFYGGLGLALQEVMFLENFRDYIAPQRVLVIGNAFGWSTLALALTFPKAKTLAIDIDADGVRVTNELIDRHGLSARAVVAQSPAGVAGAVKDHLGGAVDFCLIDAQHDNPSLVADFGAVRAVSAPDAFVLCHDVINWHMIDGVKQIETQHKLKAKLFTRTASGMALIYSTASPAFEAYLDCFSDPPERYHALRHFFLTNYGDPIARFMAGYRPGV